MGEHDKSLGDTRLGVERRLLDMWAESNGHSADAILADPALLARFLRWQTDYVAAVEEGLAAIRAGRLISDDELDQHMAEVKRQFRAHRG